MNFTDHARAVVGELGRTLGAVSPQAAEALVDLILSADRIFLAGAGRSGLAVRAFAMRLMHMGLAVYVVGDTVTPGLKADDLLIIGSGSGATASLVAMAEKAKALGARLAVVTISPDSPLGGLADLKLTIPASTPKSAGPSVSVQPMGSLFEQSLLVVFDCLVMRLMEKMALDSTAMFARHANLE